MKFFFPTENRCFEIIVSTIDSDSEPSLLIANSGDLFSVDCTKDIKKKLFSDNELNDYIVAKKQITIKVLAPDNTTLNSLKTKIDHDSYTLSCFLLVYLGNKYGFSSINHSCYSHIVSSGVIYEKKVIDSGTTENFGVLNFVISVGKKLINTIEKLVELQCLNANALFIYVSESPVEIKMENDKLNIKIEEKKFTSIDKAKYDDSTDKIKFGDNNTLELFHVSDKEKGLKKIMEKLYGSEVNQKYFFESQKLKKDSIEITSDLKIKAASINSGEPWQDFHNLKIEYADFTNDGKLKLDLKYGKHRVKEKTIQIGSSNSLFDQLKSRGAILK